MLQIRSQQQRRETFYWHRKRWRRTSAPSMPVHSGLQTETNIFPPVRSFSTFFLRLVVLQSSNQVTTLPTQVAHAAFVLIPSDVNGSKNVMEHLLCPNHTTSVLQCHSFITSWESLLSCSCDAGETVCGHVCVEVHADMHMSVLFITCRCLVSTLAMDTAKLVSLTHEVTVCCLSLVWRWLKCSCVLMSNYRCITSTTGRMGLCWWRGSVYFH